MEFKIDTKDSYTHITPVANVLNANLTDGLRQKWNVLAQNLIVDLHNCIEADTTSLDALVALHEDCYAGNNSLVFTGIRDEIMQQLKASGAAEALNIVPTFAEAVDIISMEILERDLFNEES